MLWKLGASWRVRAEAGLGDQAKGRAGGDERMGKKGQQGKSRASVESMMECGQARQGTRWTTGSHDWATELAIDHRTD